MSSFQMLRRHWLLPGALLMLLIGVTTLTSGCGNSGASNPPVIVPPPAIPAARFTPLNPPVTADTTPAAWPFARPALSSLRAAPQKVFAHYFPPFPRSIDNRAPDADYYTTQYLRPEGESGKWAFCGGFVRERPRTRSPRGSDWVALDLRDEVLEAASVGLDGFTVDVLASSGANWDRVTALYASAAAADPGFRLIAVADMQAEFAAHPENLVPTVRALAALPATYRLADGRMVLSAFNASAQSAAWWRTQLEQLASVGVHVAFFPIFLDWRGNAAAFAPISWGLSSWGVRSPGNAARLRYDTVDAQAAAGHWMAPIGVGDVRPKNLTFVETLGSAGHRAAWASAIDSHADWAHVLTWNDYGECSQMAPSSGCKGTWLALTAYYTTWFKSGSAPVITRDALYYFHRTHTLAASPDLTRQRAAFRCVEGTPVDCIELVAFLTAPGRLTISTGAGAGSAIESTTIDASAGVTVLTAPLRVGLPRFMLSRGGTTVFDFASRWDVADGIIFQDLVYRSGDSSMPVTVGYR